MKTLFRISAAAMLLLVACAPKEEPQDLGDQTITIRATLEPETRTTLQNGGTQVYWEPGDAISVFFKGTGGCFTAQNTDLATTAEFTGTMPVLVGANEGASSKNYIWGLYPYSREAKWSTSNLGGCIETYLPEVQYARPGTFAKEANISIAKSTGFDLAFYNACGGMRFTLTQEGIDEVRFKRNDAWLLDPGRLCPVAGTIAVHFKDGEPYTDIDITDATRLYSEIILKAPEDEGTFQTGVWYYIVLLPHEMPEGFTLEFHKADGTVAEKKTTKSFTIKRGIFGSVQNIDAGLEFSDGRVVDMGLSVKWASYNLGAGSPEDYGDYFSWGETRKKISSNGSYWSFDWSLYRLCNGDEYMLTKYYGSTAFGSNPDGRIILEPEDDAAYVNWGSEWRMPTDAEWNELHNTDNCEWEKVTINDVAGFKVTSKIPGYTDKWLFFPLNGSYYGTRRSNAGVVGEYWTSHVGDNNNYSKALAAYLSYNGLDTGNVYAARCYGMGIRPVLPSPESVSWIKLSQTSLNLLQGETVQLTATVLPGTAVNKKVTWSSNSDALSVDAQGKVTALKAGGGTITATTEDGARKAECIIFVSLAVPETVDLGLSVLWASFNLGASKPSDYGSYFAWGETEPRTKFSWSTYKWGTSSSNLTKYNGQGVGGTQLEPSDDAAYVQLQGNWRMPTEEEMTELVNNCTWTWTSQDGVDGYKVAGKGRYANKNIFLPAAGYRGEYSISEEGWAGEYWTSTLYLSRMDHAYQLSFMKSWDRISDFDRSDGLSIRPVWCESVTGVSLNKTALNLDLYKTEQLIATVYPTDATNKDVQWSSSDASVASVDQNGLVTAHKMGRATITVTTVNGNKTATCAVTVVEPQPEYVDLGLGVKWATFNLGAMRPEDYGDYIAWGEENPKGTYDWSTYTLCEGGLSTRLTHYCFDYNYGKEDYRYMLLPEHDAANKRWGGTWRMPTNEEWTSLKNNCTWTWETLNGVSGYRVTSNIRGYTDKSIFLPAAGYIAGDELSFAGSVGEYWLSELYENGKPSDALCIYFESGARKMLSITRAQGRSVRPVYAEPTSVSWVKLDETTEFLTVLTGSMANLTATVLPETARNKTVYWASENPDVASVDQNGKIVSGSTIGGTVITATTADGGRVARCKVRTMRYDVSWTDLGLSVLWADFNVGASAINKPGFYIAWGETVGKSSYNWSTYTWCEGTQQSLTKYNFKSQFGYVDNKLELEMRDDAARFLWGGLWRTPTPEEWKELFTECNISHMMYQGIKGMKVQSRKPGYTDKWIFLPFAGFKRDESLYKYDEKGEFMTSSLQYEGNLCYAPIMPYTAIIEDSLNDTLYKIDCTVQRSQGISVRPVWTKELFPVQ